MEEGDEAVHGHVGLDGGFTDGEDVVEAAGVDHVARIELLAARRVRAAVVDAEGLSVGVEVPDVGGDGGDGGGVVMVAQVFALEPGAVEDVVGIWVWVSTF